MFFYFFLVFDHRPFWFCSETLPVEYMRGEPVCMMQYSQLLSSCRIPGLMTDSMAFYAKSPNAPKHITVVHNSQVRCQRSRTFAWGLWFQGPNIYKTWILQRKLKHWLKRHLTSKSTTYSTVSRNTCKKKIRNSWGLTWHVYSENKSPAFSLHLLTFFEQIFLLYSGNLRSRPHPGLICGLCTCFCWDSKWRRGFTYCKPSIHSSKIPPVCLWTWIVCTVFIGFFVCLFVLTCFTSALYMLWLHPSVTNSTSKSSVVQTICGLRFPTRTNTELIHLSGLVWLHSP